MPTAIFLAQAVTDSMYPSPPSPGLCSMGSKCWWLLHMGFALQSSYSFLFVEVCLGKEEAGEQRKEYIRCRSNKQKGLWILLHAHMLWPGRWDNWRIMPTSHTWQASSCYSSQARSFFPFQAYKGQDALNWGVFGRVRGSLCKTKPKNHPHPQKTTQTNLHFKPLQSKSHFL